MNIKGEIYINWRSQQNFTQRNASLKGKNATSIAKEGNFQGNEEVIKSICRMSSRDISIVATQFCDVYTVGEKRQHAQIDVTVSGPFASN